MLVVHLPIHARLLLLLLLPPPAASSEVGHAAVVAPVAGAAPPQRLGLWPSDLARLGVLVAVKLGGRAAPHAARGGLVG